MLGIGTILYVALLVINAIAVLSEERFLARIGWSTVRPQGAAGYNDSYSQPGASGAPQEAGVKTQLINLIGAVRTLMRIPLIAINIGFIVYELILG